MVAYYAHSHGNGHCNTAKLFCGTIWKHTIIITSKRAFLNEDYGVEIINDEDTTIEEYKLALPNLPKYAHYLPKRNKKITIRTRQILDICLKMDISLALIDVSVETAIIFRIASVPYGYLVLPGHRKDSPHMTAFAAAEFCYTFLPKFMFGNFQSEIIEKTYFLGFYSRFRFSTAHCLVETEPNLKGKRILIICGNGGTEISRNLIETVKKNLVDCTITSVGNINGSHDLDNHIQFTEDIENIINHSDIVISSCGVNLTSEILALKNKFISIAEDRPYDEQTHIQNALIEYNLSVRFDINNIENCIKSFLKLRPPNALRDWFLSDSTAELFRKKIKSYETTGYFSDNYISQEASASLQYNQRFGERKCTAK